MEIYIKDNNGDFIPIKLEDAVYDINFEFVIQTDYKRAKFSINNGCIELDDVDVWVDSEDAYIELMHAIERIYLGDANQFHVTPKE